VSRMNAPAYCRTKPAAPPIPQAPLRSPTPAESAQDLEEEEVVAAFFFGADAGLEAEGFLVGDDALVDAAAAVARRDERRAGVVVAILVKSSFQIEERRVKSLLLRPRHRNLVLMRL